MTSSIRTGPTGSVLIRGSTKNVQTVEICWTQVIRAGLAGPSSFFIAGGSNANGVELLDLGRGCGSFGGIRNACSLKVGVSKAFMIAAGIGTHLN